MFHSCGHPQWRAEGICIGSGLRAEMGFTRKRNHFKRPYLPGLIFLITWLMYPRLIKNSTRKERWLTGMVWAVLTVIFEFATGITGGNSIAELLAAYNPLTGNLWLLVLAATLFSPVAAGLSMRKTDDDYFAKAPVK